MESPREIVGANSDFASRQEARDYIAAALPRVTAANPEYFTKNEGVKTRWLTKSVRFADAAAGVEVTMDEEFIQTKAGASTVGTHQAAFSLAEVDISETTEFGDITPTGEPAIVILFKCVAPRCVRADWNGQPSLSDSADISVQDPAARAKLLAAFRLLKGGAVSAG